MKDTAIQDCRCGECGSPIYEGEDYWRTPWAALCESCAEAEPACDTSHEEVAA